MRGSFLYARLHECGQGAEYGGLELAGSSQLWANRWGCDYPDCAPGCNLGDGRWLEGVPGSWDSWAAPKAEFRHLTGLGPVATRVVEEMAVAELMAHSVFEGLRRLVVPALETGTRTVRL